MSLYTHWVCFDCRKSFHNFPGEMERKCPDCHGQMVDMGIYFEPPRRSAKRLWTIMRLQVDSGYSFQTEGSKVFIEEFLICNKRPRVEDVGLRIEKYRAATLSNKRQPGD